MQRTRQGRHAAERNRLAVVNGPRWETSKYFCYADGSLRDLYSKGTSLPDWKRLTEIAAEYECEYLVGDGLARSDIVRFVSILSKSPRSASPTPMLIAARGQWLVKVLARENRFAVGLYRRRMKVIDYLGSLDRVLGVPVTTRSWNTIEAIAAVLENGAT